MLADSEPRAGPSREEPPAAGEEQPGLGEEQPGEEQPGQSLLEQLRQLWDSLRMTIFIIGSGIIFFAALRNTITWHLQWFWGASGNYWQANWLVIYDWFQGDSFKMGVWGTFIVTNSMFWLVNTLLTIFDVTGHPRALLKYKIQEDKNNPLELDKLKTALKLCLFNSCILGFLSTYVGYFLLEWRGCDFSPELPTFHWVLLELIVFILVEEVGFYYSHRMMHHPRLYKHIHKIHHEWTAPIGMIGIYAHPLEHIVSNLLPPLIGPLLMGSHIATVWLWYMMALTSTSVAHCGYHFPFLPSPEAHDYHHLKFNNNFGTLGVLDRLHGTDTQFRKSKQYLHHFLLLGICPVKQIIADQMPPPKGTCGKPAAPTATAHAAEKQE